MTPHAINKVVKLLISIGEKSDMRRQAAKLKNGETIYPMTQEELEVFNRFLEREVPYMYSKIIKEENAKHYQRTDSVHTRDGQEAEPDGQ